ncbi:MAG: zinc ribbon domain-containing protein [Candidatus Omnitrophica bacterium]|nr:zinc ribbon domain-containing protein [Candidatus Omnitrophota bacterium]
MPTYEYECSKCAHRFEKFQNMSDEPLKRCPSCGGKAERLIGAGSGIIFKGSGFYQTDYKKAKNPEREAPSCPKAGECKECPLSEKKK